MRVRGQDCPPTFLACRSPLVATSCFGVSYALDIGVVGWIQLLDKFHRSALSIDYVGGSFRTLRAYRETAIIGLLNKVVLSR